MHISIASKRAHTKHMHLLQKCIWSYNGCMSIRTCVGRTKELIFEILFPPICVGCTVYLPATNRSPLCTECESSIPRNTSLRCPICETRLSTNRRICNHGHQNSIRFPYLLGAATNYENKTVQHIIHLCKYQKVHSLSDVCARLLLEYMERLDPQPALLGMNPVVVPIPLHPKKERERGFNQSALIAQLFAHAKGLPYMEPLIKTRYDGPQAKTKTHTERFTRMQGAFVIADPSLVQNKNIILIDDVSTSGATLSEAAQTLRAAGAKQILALVVAKA